MPHFFTILLVALTFSLVVWSHPVRADQSLVAREAGVADQVVVILNNLNQGIESFNNHYNTHADTSADIKRIEANTQKARADIAALGKAPFRNLTSAESNRIKDAAKRLVGNAIKAGELERVSLAIGDILTFEVTVAASVPNDDIDP